MKLIPLAAALLLLAPIVAQAQTDAMPPEQMAKPMAPMHEDAKPPIAPSRSLTVTYAGKSITLSIEDLLALPQQTITARDGHTNKDVTFSGPLVADVLAKAGLVAGDATHQTILHSTVVATGSDGYFVLYACAELEPMFNSGKAIVAIMRGGDLPNADGGNIQLVSPNDIKPARWVHSLTSLSVMTLAPTK